MSAAGELEGYGQYAAVPLCHSFPLTLFALCWHGLQSFGKNPLQCGLSMGCSSHQENLLHHLHPVFFFPPFLNIFPQRHRQLGWWADGPGGGVCCRAGWTMLSLAQGSPWPLPREIAPMVPLLSKSHHLCIHFSGHGFMVLWCWVHSWT